MSNVMEARPHTGTIRDIAEKYVRACEEVNSCAHESLQLVEKESRAKRRKTECEDELRKHVGERDKEKLVLVGKRVVAVTWSAGQTTVAIKELEA
jgi:hypothetical protein